MLDLEKQISYWIEGANGDIETAKILIENKKYLQGLFFCHLALEKGIKANVVKNTMEIPPKTHNLLYLKEKANLDLSAEDEIFLGVLMKYQLEGRYPDLNPFIPNIDTIVEYLSKTQTVVTWLKNQL